MGKFDIYPIELSKKENRPTRKKTKKGKKGHQLWLYVWHCVKTRYQASHFQNQWKPSRSSHQCHYLDTGKGRWNLSEWILSDSIFRTDRQLDENILGMRCLSDLSFFIQPKQDHLWTWILKNLFFLKIYYVLLGMKQNILFHSFPDLLFAFLFYFWTFCLDFCATPPFSGLQHGVQSERRTAPLFAVAKSRTFPISNGLLRLKTIFHSFWK